MLARGCQSFPLLAYVTSAAICNDANDLRNIRQRTQEDKILYMERIDDAAYKGRKVFDEVHEMILIDQWTLTKYSNGCGTI